MKEQTKFILIACIVIVVFGYFTFLLTARKPVSSVGGLDYSTNVTNSGVNVGTVSTQILTAKGSRQNTSLSECAGKITWVSKEDTAVVGTGILLTPSLTISDFIDQNNPFTGNVYAISAVGGARICYTDK